MPIIPISRSFPPSIVLYLEDRTSSSLSSVKHPDTENLTYPSSSNKPSIYDPQNLNPIAKSAPAQSLSNPKNATTLNLAC
jgi:hypothetical protein